MIKVVVLEDFNLKDFNELKNLERGSNKNQEGKLFKGDKFECNEKMCEYLTGKNPLNRAVVQVIEVIPEVKKEIKEEAKVEAEEIIKPVKKSTKKKKK